MNRADVFSFRVSPAERRTIADLAARLQRSQSDAVRFVVIQAARQLVQVPASPDDVTPADDLGLQQGAIASGGQPRSAYPPSSGGDERV
jgi:hypothetical protein